MRRGVALAVGAAPAGCGRAARRDAERRRRRAGCGEASRSRDAEGRRARSMCGASWMRRCGGGRRAGHDGGAAARPPPWPSPDHYLAWNLRQMVHRKNKKDRSTPTRVTQYLYTRINYCFTPPVRYSVSSPWNFALVLRRLLAEYLRRWAIRSL
jgi:hypothetical protein